MSPAKKSKPAKSAPSAKPQHKADSNHAGGSRVTEEKHYVAVLVDNDQLGEHGKSLKPGQTHVASNDRSDATGVTRKRFSAR